ncbi:putative nuclease HARBI1 [Ornithodoros turicata]|uniref:putative nuclease HARBI1 n=1 Tax=Ornithodoros turicata TaxID=34597 RepID=UPI003139440B
MAEGFFSWAITQAADRAPRTRRRQDAFQLDETDFVKLFRLSKNAARTVCEDLRPYITPSTWRLDALPVETKVLCALHFYGSGSYQTPVGNQLEIGLPQSTSSRCTRQVTNAMQQPALVQRWIKFPVDAATIWGIKDDFYETYRFPGIIGAIDCTHVPIVAPATDEFLYVNRKGYHSMNVQLICTSELEILNVKAKYPGSTHDSFIWRNSAVREALASNRIPSSNSWLIGDSGYPLEPWLLVPYSESETAHESYKENFNIRHKEARAIIEQCNGLLKSRFRCLHRHRVLHYAPSVVGQIVNACAILHNICLSEGLRLEDEIEGDSGMFDTLTNHNEREENSRSAGARVLDHVARQLTGE